MVRTAIKASAAPKGYLGSPKDDHTPGQSMFDEDDDESDRWYKTILISVGLMPFCDSIFLAKDAFEKEMVKTVVAQSASLARAVTIGFIDMGDKPFMIITHSQREGCPEAYIVSMLHTISDPQSTKHFSVWSSGPPYKKPAEP